MVLLPNEHARMSLRFDDTPYGRHDATIESPLSKQSIHTGKTSTRQDISVGCFVLPVYYAQDTADASQVECVEPSLLLAVPGIYVVYVSLLYRNVLVTRTL